MKKAIHTKNAPAPIGPYSQAVVHNNLIFVSGQIALQAETCELNNKTFIDEAKQTLENLRFVLEAANSSMNQIIKATIYLTDLAYFEEFNNLYATYLQQPYPARAVIGVSQLPKGCRVEIEAVASISTSSSNSS